jgi:tight adherence protein B
VADLVAALLAAGLPTAAALRVVVAAAREAGLAEPAGVEPLVEALALADATGLAPAGLVRAAAAEQRRRLSAARSVAAGRLSVLVVLPMGLCLLPAFVLLTVAPLAIGLLQS